MNLPASEPSSESNRLERLEQSVRRLTSVSVMLALAFVVLLIWQFFPRTHALAAPGFVLADGHGKMRAELILRDDGTPMLRLNDPAEKARISMFLREDGASVMRMTDASGVNRAELLVDKDGLPALSLGAPDGKAIVTIGTSEDGTPRIELAATEHHPAWSTP